MTGTGSADSVDVLRQKVEGIDSIKITHATFRGAHQLGSSKWKLLDRVPALSPGKLTVASGSQGRGNANEKATLLPLSTDVNPGSNFRPGDVRALLPHLD